MKLHGIVNCDTVKKACAWLDLRGIRYEFVDFRRTPPTRETLARWCDTAGWQTVLNRRGTTWRKLDPGAQARVGDAESAIEAMLAHPMSVKRPVVEAGDAVIVGFDAQTWEASLAARR